MNVRWSRRQLMAMGLAVAPPLVGFGRSTVSAQEGGPRSFTTIAGQPITWSDPWTSTQNQVDPDGAYDSLILDFDAARIAFVTHAIPALSDEWNTPATFRDMLVEYLDQNDRELLATFDDNAGSQALTYEDGEEGPVARYYLVFLPSPEFLVQIGFYSPPASFAEAWTSVMSAVGLDGSPVFAGVGPERIVVPVTTIADENERLATAAPIPVTDPDAAAWLAAARDLVADLQASAGSVNDSLRTGNIYDRSYLASLRPYVRVWAAAPDAVANLTSPSSRFDDIHDALGACAAAFGVAADRFLDLANLDREGMGPNPTAEEFYQALDVAEDLAAPLAETLGQYDIPG